MMWVNNTLGLKEFWGLRTDSKYEEEQFPLEITILDAL